MSGNGAVYSAIGHNQCAVLLGSPLGDVSLVQDRDTASSRVPRLCTVNRLPTTENGPGSGSQNKTGNTRPQSADRGTSLHLVSSAEI